jgi:hypothetical protein
MMKESTTLISWVHNEVEVSCYQPRLHMKIINILQLLEEGTLIHLTLGGRRPCEPQTLVFPDGNTCRECIRGEVGM